MNIKHLTVTLAIAAACSLVGCAHKPPTVANPVFLPAGGTTGDNDTDIVLLQVNGPTPTPNNFTDLVPDDSMILPPRTVPMDSPPLNAIDVPVVNIPGTPTLTIDSDNTSTTLGTVTGLTKTNSKVWKINPVNSQGK
jgi:hypothetical protein